MTNKCIDEGKPTGEDWYTKPGDHQYTKITKTWQKREPIDGRIINFSKEIVVCLKCGKVIDPWEDKK